MLHLRLTDRDIERVLAGHQPHGRPDLAEVARLTARIRAVSNAEQPPPMSPRLLAELDAAEMERRSEGQDRQGRRKAQVARWRWRMVGAAAVMVMLGGLAFAGLRDRSSGPQTEIGDTGSTGSVSAPPPDAPAAVETSAAPPSTEAPPTTTATTSPPASSAPPATTGPQLEPEAPPDGHRGEPGGDPGWDDDNPWQRCFRDGEPDYDCLLEVYEQTHGGQSPEGDQTTAQP
jgi:hypothetical protein